MTRDRFPKIGDFIYDDEETPEGAAHSYATYIAGLWMGILTNIVLELVLVCRVHLLGGVPGGPSPRTLKVLRWAVWLPACDLGGIHSVLSKPVRKSNIAATHFGFPPQVLDAVRPSQEFRHERRTREKTYKDAR